MGALQEYVQIREAPSLVKGLVVSRVSCRECGLLGYSLTMESCTIGAVFR
jgi:hypothetical protein